MNLKMTPEKAAQMLRYKEFDNAEKALKTAKDEASGSNDALYYALSVTYYWYLQIKDNTSILQSALDSEDPKIKWVNSPADPFTPIVKLVFGLSDRKYASRVITYARVLRFIDREIFGDEAIKDIYEDHLNNPELGKNIIEAAGGVTDCAADQQTWENPKPKGTASQDDINRYLSKECQSIYADKDAIDKVSISTNTPEGDFILMMGRVGANSDVEIVETLDASPTEILALVEGKAFQDTSGVDATINLLADSLGFLNIYRPADKPIVSVEKGGNIIRLGLDREHLASVVTTVKLKDGYTLANFPDRAYLGRSDYDWFVKNAQEHKHRRLYSVAPKNASNAIEAFEFTNNVNQETKVLHFSAMSKPASKQVVLDDQNSTNWPFIFDVDRDTLQSIYLGWLVGWKGLEKKKNSHRIITANFSVQGINLESDCSTPMGFSFNTGLPQGDTFDFSMKGDEFIKVIEEILENPNFDKVSIRGLESGVLEFIAEDSMAEYYIDIPTVAEDMVRHNNKHFAKLA